MYWGYCRYVDRGHYIGLIYVCVVIKMDNKSVEATSACAPGHSRWHLEKDIHIIRFLNGFQNVDNNRAKNFQSPRGSAQRVPEPDPLPSIFFDSRPDPIQF